MQDVHIDLEGRDVVIVEDIVDTGLTLAYLSAQLAARGPRASMCARCSTARVRRIVPETVRYRGVEIPTTCSCSATACTIADLYRNLPFVAVADRGRRAGPTRAYVAELYGAAGPGGGPIQRDAAGTPVVRSGRPNGGAP